MPNEDFSLSVEAKREYLQSLIGKIHKILHLIEEEKNTGYSPADFIWAQILEANAANILFNGKLVNIIIKLKVIYDNLGVFTFKENKKQIFEIKRIINSLLRNLEEKNVNQE